MVDGVEVINGENMSKWNIKCTLLGFNLDKSITGGSDGHTLYHMAKVVTYSDNNMNRKKFLNAVKKKKTKVIGKPLDMLRKVTANSLKMRRNLKNYPDLVEKNIKYGYTVLGNQTRRIKDNVKRVRIKRKKA